MLLAIGISTENELFVWSVLIADHQNPKDALIEHAGIEPDRILVVATDPNNDPNVIIDVNAEDLS